MSPFEINNAISANNDGFVMSAGYELAILKDGKIMATGNDVEQKAFNHAGDQFINCFSNIVDIRERRTPQHNYTSKEGVAIPHANKEAQA